jgi:uncharacterized membrane protein
MWPLNHLHPLIVHFPIVLLLLAPAVALAGLLWPGQRPGLHATALALLVLGSAAAAAALITGEAAAALAQRTPALRAALVRHESLAQATTLLAVLQTILFALIRLDRWWSGGPLRAGKAVAACALWLGLSLVTAILLTRAAHEGGRMVHPLAIHSTQLQESP